MATFYKPTYKPGKPKSSTYIICSDCNTHIPADTYRINFNKVKGYNLSCYQCTRKQTIKKLYSNTL